MTCPHCLKRIPDKMVLSAAAGLPGRASRIPAASP
jgi:hypothetical protein